jgi:deazaflavin-dependent oxidoreductase (nitroreductase family)
MAYLKPPWFTRTIFNKIAMTLRFGPFETLTVIKRVSRQPQKIPVTPIEVDGVKYLVSAYGETQWVKNVRANPDVKLGGVDYVASEATVDARQPILDAYQAKVGKYVEQQFRTLPDPADHPVFTLTPQT